VSPNVQLSLFSPFEQIFDYTDNEHSHTECIWTLCRVSTFIIINQDLLYKLSQSVAYKNIRQLHVCLHLSHESDDEGKYHISLPLTKYEQFWNMLYDMPHLRRLKVEMATSVFIQDLLRAKDWRWPIDRVIHRRLNRFDLHLNRSGCEAIFIDFDLGPDKSSRYLSDKVSGITLVVENDVFTVRHYVPPPIDPESLARDQQAFLEAAQMPLPDENDADL